MMKLLLLLHTKLQTTKLFKKKKTNQADFTILKRGLSLFFMTSRKNISKCDLLILVRPFYNLLKFCFSFNSSTFVCVVSRMKNVERYQ